MESCNVLIVGGGPAGSSVAWSLRRSGLDVVVMDRRAFPRDKVCAGWITPAVVDALRLDLEDYRRGRVLQPIHGFRVGSIGGREVCTRPSPEPLSYGIRRCEFDQYLLQRSAARLRLDRAFGKMRRDGDGWVIDDGMRARLVVGAGGHFCPVARALGAAPGGGERAVLAQEVEFEMTSAQRAACTVDPAVPELFFCRDLAGYGWAFRKGDHLNIGLGREDPNELSGHVAAFRRLLVARGKAPPDTPGKFKGHAYLLYPHAPRELLGDGVLLVGDAAGLAYPESGEGIRPAVESGLIAAEVIRAAQGDFSRERLAAYGDRLVRRFGAREPRRGLPGLLPRSLKESLAAKLLTTEWFARRVVIDRWFLRTHLAALESPPPEARPRAASAPGRRAAGLPGG